MTKRKTAGAAACFIMCSMLLTGCTKMNSIKLPELPDFSAVTPPPIASAEPAPSPTPAVGPKPTVVPIPSPMSEASPEPSETPFAEAAPTTETKPSPTPTPAVSSTEPSIEIIEEAVPTDMLVYNVAEVTGKVIAHNAVITEVRAKIINSRGEAVQDYYFNPVMGEFVLDGTVNALLKFGTLVPDQYEYVLLVTAANDKGETIQKESRHSFAVFGSKEDMGVT